MTSCCICVSIEVTHLSNICFVVPCELFTAGFLVGFFLSPVFDSHVFCLILVCWYLSLSMSLSLSLCLCLSVYVCLCFVFHHVVTFCHECHAHDAFLICPHVHGVGTCFGIYFIFSFKKSIVNSNILYILTFISFLCA